VAEIEDHKTIPVASSTTLTQAIWRGLCPRCRSGRIFAGSFRMNEPCPVCQLSFGREDGYFTGAMYVSYALAVPILGVILLVLSFWIFPTWQFHWVLSLAVGLFLPFVPAVFRYSRIIWIHLDRHIDP